MKVNFYSNNLLSELDLTTMGGSEKKGDDSKIGQFCSGLKYAIAIFNRNNVKFSAHVNTKQFIEGYNRNVNIYYHVGSYVKEDAQTDKSKELIQIEKTSDYQNFHDGVTIDEWGGEMVEYLKTDLSVDLGFDWKLQYALREIWSNMIDEGGSYDDVENPQMIKDGTVITLEFEDDSEFAEIWRNKHLYFIVNDKPIVTFEHHGKTVEIRNTDVEYLRIYKQGILVYEDQDVKSKYTYNINFGELDERRILTNVYGIKWTMGNTIINDDSDEAIEFILNMSGTEKEVFDDGLLYDPIPKQKLVDKVLEMNGDITTFGFVLEALKKMKNSPLADRKIKTLTESVYEVQRVVTIEETPTQIDAIAEDISFIDQLKEEYDFNFEYPVKEATLKGSVVVADKYNKVILVSKNFNPQDESHIMDFFIQYFDMSEEGKGNILKKITKFLINKIKK